MGAVILGLVGLALTTLLQALVQGFVFRNLYEWFVVPTFKVESMGYTAATGIVLVINYLTNQIRFSETDENGSSAFETNSEKFLALIVYSTITLAIGWVIRDAM